MSTKLSLIAQEGEGYRVEFKETLGHLDREIVAFANASGGSIYLGLKDSGEISGIAITNGIKSQIIDIARNCDPSLRVDVVAHSQEQVLEIIVTEGHDKPYRCRDGFFLRIGPNTQKLKRDEIIQLINDAGKIRFDETLNKKFKYPDDFSQSAFKEFLTKCQIQTTAEVRDILLSLNAAEEADNQLILTNAAVLFFAKHPQTFFPESYTTIACYASTDRFSLLEKQDICDTLITQIEQTLFFVKKYMGVEASFHEIEQGTAGMRRDIYDYPLLALREAIVNAVAHRDYHYDSSHTYVHVYPDRIEMENPGGLYRGITIENLGKRSVRRNRLIADLLHRAHYIERVGSGFDRMQRALEKNHNPPLEIKATNFFNIRFYKRIVDMRLVNLSDRQRKIYNVLLEKNNMSKAVLAKLFHVSNDTILRELSVLIEKKLVDRIGTGKASVYQIKK